MAINATDSDSINGGPNLLVSSPPFGFSTFIISAPISASNIEQNGPASICEQSSIFIPFKAGLIF